MIHIYYGDGKGKTTAAMGLALRMVAAGRHVVIVQFLKSGRSGEARCLADGLGVELFAGKVCDKFSWQMSDEEKTQTRVFHDALLKDALAAARREGSGLLVLDEVLDALSKGLVSEELVDGALSCSTETFEVVLTGRKPAGGLLDRADYVTEMRCVKHPYQQGLASREGVEY